MRVMTTIWSGRARGQVIVLIALAMVAMLAGVALVIDGGNAYAQQRRTQNGIDASAESGAAQLARRMVGVAASATSKSRPRSTRRRPPTTSRPSTTPTTPTSTASCSARSGPARSRPMPRAFASAAAATSNVRRWRRRPARVEGVRRGDRHHRLCRGERVRWAGPVDVPDPPDPVRIGRRLEQALLPRRRHRRPAGQPRVRHLVAVRPQQPDRDPAVLERTRQRRLDRLGQSAVAARRSSTK